MPALRFLRTLCHKCVFISLRVFSEAPVNRIQLRDRRHCSLPIVPAYLVWLSGCNRRNSETVSVLTAIKLLHTVIWAFLAGSILVLPVVGGLRRFRWAAILTVIVLLECGALAVNGGSCPLSDLAARYTDERASNFDIYLPNWLASHDKTIFGTLFVVNELIVLWCWQKRARLSSVNDGGSL